MSRKKYRKWKLSDIRKIKHLRDESRTWSDIANIFNEKKVNIIQIYKYYSPMLGSIDERKEEAVEAVMESRIRMLGIRKQDIEEIVDIVTQVVTDNH